MRKGDEIICINDDYAEDVLIKWAEHGVKHPVSGKIYHLREVVKHSSHQDREMIGIRVMEINNPAVPVDRLFPMDIEPTFKLSRFTSLLGDKLELEEEVYNPIENER